MKRIGARAASLRAAASVLAVAVSASLVGCGRTDSLERIRKLQDASHDFADTIEPLRELIASRPDDPEVQFRYGMALIATDQRALAVWPLQKALTSPEWEERAV